MQFQGRMPQQHRTALALPSSKAAKPLLLYYKPAKENLEEERKKFIAFY